MIRREHNRRPDIDIEQQLQLRLKEAERLLPLPPDEEEEAASAGGQSVEARASQLTCLIFKMRCLAPTHQQAL
jgi:hypothetical protein